MNVSAKNADANREFCSKCLQLLDEIQAFLLMCAGCIVIIQIIQQVDASVEVIEKSATWKETLIFRGESSDNTKHTEEDLPNPNLLFKNFKGPITGLEKMFSNHVNRYQN